MNKNEMNQATELVNLFVGMDPDIAQDILVRIFDKMGEDFLNETLSTVYAVPNSEYAGPVFRTNSSCLKAMECNRDVNKDVLVKLKNCFKPSEKAEKEEDLDIGYIEEIPVLACYDESGNLVVLDGHNRKAAHDAYHTDMTFTLYNRNGRTTKEEREMLMFHTNLYSSTWNTKNYKDFNRKLGNENYIKLENFRSEVKREYKGLWLDANIDALCTGHYRNEDNGKLKKIMRGGKICVTDETVEAARRALKDSESVARTIQQMLRVSGKRLRRGRINTALLWFRYYVATDFHVDELNNAIVANWNNKRFEDVLGENNFDAFIKWFAMIYNSTKEKENRLSVANVIKDYKNVPAGIDDDWNSYVNAIDEKEKEIMLGIRLKQKKH